MPRNKQRLEEEMTKVYFSADSPILFPKDTNDVPFCFELRSAEQLTLDVGEETEVSHNQKILNLFSNTGEYWCETRQEFRFDLVYHSRPVNTLSKRCSNRLENSEGGILI